MAVIFEHAVFISRFPEFATLDTALLELYFAEACLKLNNTEQSLVRNEQQRRILLYLLVAHLAQIGIQARQGNGNLVGRVSSVSEGSVSVSLEAGAVAKAEAWYMQSSYGAEYWALTAAYRSMRYVTAPVKAHP